MPVAFTKVNTKHNKECIGLGSKSTSKDVIKILVIKKDKSSVNNILTKCM